MLEFIGETKNRNNPSIYSEDRRPKFLPIRNHLLTHETTENATLHLPQHTSCNKGANLRRINSTHQNLIAILKRKLKSFNSDFEKLNKCGECSKRQDSRVYKQSLKHILTQVKNKTFDFKTARGDAFNIFEGIFPKLIFYIEKDPK